MINTTLTKEIVTPALQREIHPESTTAYKVGIPQLLDIP